MEGAVAAGLWGFVGGSALLIGAAIAYLVHLPQRLIAAIMAVGSGVLISAVAFDLMDDAYARGGFDATALGFFGGALVYTAANILVSRAGAKHRKRSGSNPAQSQADAEEGSGLSIAIGALLDGIPESVVIGVSLLQGAGVSLVTVAAVFLSNVPEGLSSAAGMKRRGAAPAISSASGARSPRHRAWRRRSAMSPWRAPIPTSSPRPPPSRRARSWPCWWIR